MSTGCAPYELLGNSFGKSFVARKVTQSRVLWLNKRWFFEQGFDVEDPNVLKGLNEKVLSFAAVVEPDYYPPSALSTEMVEMRADRYGAPVGAPTGGSGRCGYIGDWNAKGIGRTPLVGGSGAVDWYHSHGCMWIEEAVREAILAEIASSEYPHGAVPILAIIDPFLRVHGPKPEHTGERRAIVLRPNFVRIAHLERSVRFGTSGSEDSDQVKDAARTRDVIEAIERHFRGSIDLKLTVSSLDEAFRRLAQQAGFGWAHRFFAGAFFSSNVTLNGELVDFGNFRAMSDWRQCPRAGNAYGPELTMLAHSIKSVRFYAKKYAQTERLSVTVDDLRQLAKQEFVSECAACFGSSELVDALSPLFLDWLEKDSESLNRSQGFDSSEWMKQWTPGSPSANSATRYDRVLATLSERVGLERAERRMKMAQTWISPRPLLDRECMVGRFTALARSNAYEHDSYPNVIEREIGYAVSQSRRRYRALGPDDCVIERGGDANSSVLRVSNEVGDDLVLIGSFCNGKALILGQTIKLSEFVGARHEISGGSVAIRLTWPTDNAVNLGTTRIQLPILTRFPIHQDSGYPGMPPD